MEIEWKLAITWHVINALNKGNLRLNDLSVSIKNVSLMMKNNGKKTHSVVQDDYFHATTNKNWKKK